MIALADICAAVRDAMADSRVVPFVGAGVGTVGRAGSPWDPERFTPTGHELAEHLAIEFRYPECNRELSRIAQYGEFVRGEAAVARKLDGIFSQRFEPTTVHALLARETKAATGRVPFPVIMTTNYDDSLERAFAAEGVPYDVLTYQSRRRRPSLWLHERAGVVNQIAPGDDDGTLDPEQRTVILKLHGGINRQNADAGSFIISDADYAGYVDNLLTSMPDSVVSIVAPSSFLFLGYGLRDWNLRMFLLGLWRDRVDGNETMSWAIEHKPSDYDARFWRNYAIELIEASLDEWVAEMERGRA